VIVMLPTASGTPPDRDVMLGKLRVSRSALGGTIREVDVRSAAAQERSIDPLEVALDPPS